MAITRNGWRVLKLFVFVVCLMPAVSLVIDALQNNLGANPIQTLHYRTGDWALRFLLITLSLTPLKIAFGIKAPLRFRRMLGLFAFFYASLHLAVYVVLDQSLSWNDILEDIPKSPYVLVGLLAYSLLIPLAITSTRRMIQRLGRNWQRLHRLVYLIAVLGVVHFFWLVKADLAEPMAYAGILTVLLALRLFNNRRMPTFGRRSLSRGPEATKLLPAAASQRSGGD